MIVDGNTRVTFIVGTPIAQVKSPSLFNRRHNEQVMQHVQIPIDLAPDALASIFFVLRGWANCDGCIVTVPYKHDVVPLVDERSCRVERLGAANVIRRESGGKLVADHLDGLGHIRATKIHNFDPNGASVLIIGAGGTGSAIADTLADAKVGYLALADINLDRARWLRDILAAAFPAVEVTVFDGDDLSGFDLVSNASPVGMDSDDALPISAQLLDTVSPHALVSEVVTRPVRTAFLRRAAFRGCRVQTGAEMSVAQVDLLERYLQVLPSS